MDIKSLLEGKQKILKEKLEIILKHPTTKGNHCEEAWINFFRSFLPSRYSVDKGFVFDCKGNISEQIDIIIYDSQYSPLIFITEAGEKYITAESIYAVFDSKSQINKKTLEYTDKKIESVKKLHRTSRNIINGGIEQGACKPKDILGGILAVDSILPKNIQKNMDEYKNINFGCAIKSIAFLSSRDKKDGSLCEFNYSTGEDIILSFFYFVLNELFKLGTVAAIDIREYANATLDNINLK